MLHGELGAGTAVVAVVHHLEGQAGQRLEVLGGVVDGGAGGDDPERLELRHQLPALLLQAMQQIEAVGAQGAVVGVGLVQDEKRQVGDEPAHVVLGVLHLPEIMPQRPPAVEGLRVGHQPLLDHVGGHQGQPGALQDLSTLGEVAHVAVDAVDALRVQAATLGHALPAEHLVPGQGLDGVDGDGRGVGVGGQVVQGGRLEDQGLAAGGAGADRQVVALAQELQPHGLVQVELAAVRLRVHRGPDRAVGQPGGRVAVPRLLAGDGDLVVNVHGVLPATVRFAAMGNPDHQDDQLVVQQFVQDAVVAHPLAAQSPQPALQRAAGQRLFPQRVDCRDDPLPGLPGQLRQLSPRAAPNPYRAAHA